MKTVVARPASNPAEESMLASPYDRGAAYAAAADTYGWHNADPDADCPFTGADAEAWHRGVAVEATRQHDESKRCAAYYYPANV